MKTAGLLFSMMIVVASATPSVAQQASDFAAIAYSPTKRAVGIAQDNNSKDEAEGVAMQNCRAEPGGPTDCKNAAWVQRGCAALAVSSQGAWGGHYANNPDGARRNAIAQCGRYAAADAPTCAVIKVVCTSRR